MKSAKYFVMFGTCGRSVDEHQHSLRDEPLEITRGRGGGGNVWGFGSVTAFIQSPASTVKFFYTFRVQHVEEVLTGCTASLV